MYRVILNFEVVGDRMKEAFGTISGKTTKCNSSFPQIIFLVINTT